MSEVDRRFHETWLGLVQPVDGLVVSIPVLVDAQCAERQAPHVQAELVRLCPPTRQGETGAEGHTIASLAALFSDLLGFAGDAFDRENALPEELSLFVPEGRQMLRPSMALRGQGGPDYEMLVWDLPTGLDLDRPEAVTGSWEYPPTAKFDRLLRHCRVPIGLLSNGEAVRLVYAPHGESSGAITFRIEDMVSVGGRPILDAFVMLLAANRFFGVGEERTLGSILVESRKRQANVTNDLADQVFEALAILLSGFEAAAERDGGDGTSLLDDAFAREGDHLYKGLLTVLLRLVFLLYAEDRGLLPVEHPFYARHLSVLGLFEQLQTDHGAYPDSMARRFGAWGRLVTVFRAVFLGVDQDDLHMPPRRGSLFNPHEYPFLEGWGPAGSAPITQAEDRAAVRLPTIDDGTVFQVLEKLLVLEGQRLSYRALDVEQIGSVYEALMGYHVIRMTAPAVCMRPDRIWLSVEEVRAVPAGRQAKWIKEMIGLSSAQADKLADELAVLADGTPALDALAKYAVGERGQRALNRARVRQFVLQPGSERRRTSSHYTPRSLSAPIVRRTLEPLLSAMGQMPSSDRILRLKVCDPAVGSGAFLVEACRFLADQVFAAWTREGQIEAIAAQHGDPVLHARRLVAQRCLYGVDKNEAAVELARLSLWLVTLSKSLPFTFLDHALRHGDSLVGLDFDQLRAFHWKRIEEGIRVAVRGRSGKRRPDDQVTGQLSLFGREIELALSEAIALRQKIGDLGDAPIDDREKERLHWDAQDALDRVRLIGDVVVGAFFAHDNDRDRERERTRREDLVRAWLGTSEPPTEELREMQRAIQARTPVFHWMVEFPEIFYAERPDPLDADQVNRAAYVDAFIGNPPFADKNEMSERYGTAYIRWLQAIHIGVHGATDLSAHFFRRAEALLGANGTLGLIATKTISQGETRTSGLLALIRDGYRIYDATTKLSWPGSANVTVAVVHLATGTALLGVERTILNNVNVPTISSRLTSEPERTTASPLGINETVRFPGCKTYGPGFIIQSRERADLIMKSAKNSERVFTYIRGEEVNQSPTGSADGFVINFGQLPLDAARAWPDLLQIVEERVRPSRELAREDTADGAHRKKYWWQFAQPRPELSEAISGLQRCIVAARDPQHLCFTFQPTDRVFSEKLWVFAVQSTTALAVLQSRPHIVWATYNGRTTGGADTSSYSASACFDTFPFPAADPRSVIAELEVVGQRLYDARASYMVDEDVGLTTTYNRLLDSANSEARILELRALHEEMDRAVIAGYAEFDVEGRWGDVTIPPFCPITDTDKQHVIAFEDAVIDRLFALNARRAAEESGKREASRKKAASTKSAIKAKSVTPGGRRKKVPADVQLEMSARDELEG